MIKSIPPKFCESARIGQVNRQSRGPLAIICEGESVFENLLRSLMLAVAAAILLAQASVSLAEPISRDLGQVAIEEAEVQFLLNEDGTGSITARCPDCPAVVILTIDENSRAFIEQEPATFQEAAAVLAQSAGVVYDPKSNSLVHIQVRTQQR